MNNSVEPEGYKTPSTDMEPTPDEESSCTVYNDTGDET